MDSKELFGEINEPVVTSEPVVIQEEKAVSEINATAETEENIVWQEQELTSEQIQQQVEKNTKKGNNSLVVTFATLMFILIIGLCIYIAVAISDMLPQGGGKDKAYEAQTEDPWEEILGEGYNEEQPEEQTTAESENDVTEENNEYDTDDIYTYPNYAADTFTGPYYDDIVDCMDETVSYGIERKFCNIKEPENSVDIHTSYICLEGDIPGINEINRILEEDAIYFAEKYKNNKEEMLEMLDGKYKLDASVRSFVTYNTENMISIVIREDISIGGMLLDVRLKSYNINLDTGMILDNSSVLDLKEDFAREFRERSERQNGTGSVDIFSDAEILELLTEKESVIFFYTPMGAELGYNYDQSGYQGWITITMQDYEEYLRTL